MTRYEYDKNGSRTKVIYADGTCVETEYDERGRNVWQTGQKEPVNMTAMECVTLCHGL